MVNALDLLIMPDQTYSNLERQGKLSYMVLLKVWSPYWGGGGGVDGLIQRMASLFLSLQDRLTYPYPIPPKLRGPSPISPWDMMIKPQSRGVCVRWKGRDVIMWIYLLTTGSHTRVKTLPSLEERTRSVTLEKIIKSENKKCTHFAQPEVCDTSLPVPLRTLQTNR